MWVEIDGQHVGYLSRDDAAAYRSVMRRLTAQVPTCPCAALIKGGWRKATGGEGDFGVELELASPQTVLRWLDRV